MSGNHFTRRQVLELAAISIAASMVGLPAANAEDIKLLSNSGFESGSLSPWIVEYGKAELVKQSPYEGDWCLSVGPGWALVKQTIKVKPNSNYKLKGWLKSGSGASEVRLGVKDYSGGEKTAAIARVDFTEAEIEFTTGNNDHQVSIFIQSPGNDTTSFADSMMLTYTGEAVDEYAGMTNSIFLPPARIPITDQGVTQQSDEKMKWLLEAKFGMFIHWGLYAGPGRGEWLMNNEGILPEKYRRYAYPESGDEYFSADKYDPQHWADVAKAAGMKWMCMVTRHHDGYSLFDSPHPNAFTSVQTHKRDFIAEYVKACRKTGLVVGMYYSPLSWRYPGYYDVSGTDCKPNAFGYHTDPAHKENARLMKEENYANVRQLMTHYGKIDYIFWDGGWLGQRGSDADAAYFHEPGEFLDPNNAWPIDKKYIDTDSKGRPLGIMGMVRKHQPDMITNGRYGWHGDIGDEEGGGILTGRIREPQIIEKCISMHGGAWGYAKDAIEHGDVFTRDYIIELLISCVVRNMVLLLNFGPDRHGQMPPIVEKGLLEAGAWIKEAAEAIYGTHGGPWQPVDGQYGYCYKHNTIYLHIFKGFSGETLIMPPVGPLHPVKAYDVITKKPVVFKLNDNRTITISNIDRSVNPVDTIIAVRFDKDVLAYAKEAKQA